MINGKAWSGKAALAPMEGYNVQYSNDMAIECGVLGIISLGLATVNVVCIFISAIILLKIKEVAQLSSMSPSTRRFFHEDIKVRSNHHLPHS